VITRSTVGFGRCTKRKRRLQGRNQSRHRTSWGAAGSQVGPHAKSLAILLHYALGLGFAKTAQLLGHLGVPVSAGAICSASQTIGTDLVPVHKGIAEAINRSSMVVMDETGWRVGGGARQ
jgi:hypothetical protein